MHKYLLTPIAAAAPQSFEVAQPSLEIGTETKKLRNENKKHTSPLQSRQLQLFWCPALAEIWQSDCVKKKHHQQRNID